MIQKNVNKILEQKYIKIDCRTGNFGQEKKQKGKNTKIEIGNEVKN